MSVYRRETHVKIAYDLEQADFARAHRQRRKHAFSRLVPGLSVVALILCAEFFWRLPVSGALVGSAALIGFVTWLMWWVLVRLPAKNIEIGWDDRRHQRLEVNDEAFEIHDRVSGKKVSWDFIMHWLETDDDFFIFVEGGLYHLIPKRILGGADAETSLRRLLEEHVATGGEARLAEATKGSWAFIIYVGVLILLLATTIEALGVLLFG